MSHRRIHRRSVLGMLAAPIVAFPARSIAETNPFAWQRTGESPQNGWFEDYEPPVRTPSAPNRTDGETPVVRAQPHQRGQRRLAMVNARNNESLDVVYWRNGSYQSDALRAIYSFMRDWRDDTTLRMSNEMIDFVYRTHAELATTQPFILVSGARSRATNQMLIARSRERNGGVSQVASNSLHLYGRANDLRMSGHSVATIASAARRVRGAGGVGRYSGSNFVHFDDGPYRTWGA